MPRGDLDRDAGGIGRWLLLAVVLLLAGGGAGLYFAGDRVSEQLHLWFASSSSGDLAGVPQPRTAGTDTARPGPATLADMPALVVTDAAAPETWPDLAPA